MFAKTYAKYYDLLNSDKPYKKECAFVYKWAEKPKSIFDIGAGTGNYWKYYPSDVDMFGVDNSPEMTDRASELICIVYGDIMRYKLHSQIHPCGYDCATALFNVINYIPKHDWWAENINLKKGGYFIFDVWDKKKVDTSGFRMTIKSKSGITRIINPLSYDGKRVKLNVTLASADFEETELHTMYIYNEAEIKRFCGRQFKIVDKKETKTWQTFYKLRRV